MTSTTSEAAHPDLVVVGASAGGVEALRDLVAGLPAGLPAAVLVVLHMPNEGTSALAAILTRSGPLPAVTAIGVAALAPATITVAQPDHHLVVRDGETAISRGPTESGHRPAVDALFRSAAHARGRRVVGVQLSGTLDDGAAGMVAIAAAGGTVLVQDPTDALHPDMPAAVLSTMKAHHVAPAHELGAIVGEVVAGGLPPEPGGGLSELEKREHDIAVRGDLGWSNELDAFGEPAGYACPDCDGALIALAGTRRFRCRVGHAWTAEALLAEQGGRVERALWTAYRMLEERAALAKRLDADITSPGLRHRRRRAHEEAGADAEALRTLLLSGLPPERLNGPSGG